MDFLLFFIAVVVMNGYLVFIIYYNRCLIRCSFHEYIIKRVNRDIVRGGKKVEGKMTTRMCGAIDMKTMENVCYIKKYHFT